RFVDRSEHDNSPFRRAMRLLALFWIPPAHMPTAVRFQINHMDCPIRDGIPRIMKLGDDSRKRSHQFVMAEFRMKPDMRAAIAAKCSRRQWPKLARIPINLAERTGERNALAQAPFILGEFLFLFFGAAVGPTI